MEKITKKQMIEHLAKFRAAGDLINDDLNKLSQSILSIYQNLSVKERKTDDEEEVCRQLRELMEPIIQSVLNSYNYNQSMRHDYTKVVRALGASSDVNSHGD